MKILAKNKQAYFNYKLLEKHEAGLVLSGQEVKSVKTGHISLKGSFISLRENELYLINANIPPYKFAGDIPNYDPGQPRKLLVKKNEIKSIIGKIQSKGLTLIPIQVYTKRRLVKLEFALAEGKKKHDKRKDIAEREAKRKAERALKNY